MSTPYPGAIQVGSYFVGQYYQVLQQQPDLVHQFYSDASKAVRVDGDSSETALTMLHIHNMVMSLNFTAIEIKTINSLESWDGGVLVMVSGSVKTKEFSNRRNFVQTFFLAPQEKGYFVLNDIFQFVDDGTVFHQQHPHLSESKQEAQLNPPNAISESEVPDYVLEQEARDYVNSVRIEDDPIDKYSLPEEPHQPHQEYFDNEVVVEETPVEDVYASHLGADETVHEPSAAPAEEPVGEKSKMTYASILRVAREAAAVPAVPTQPSYNQSFQSTNEWEQSSQPLASQVTQQTIVPHPGGQQSNTSFPYVPDYGAEAEDSSGFEDFEFKSVYVRNLPSNITAAEIEEEFKNFGAIKPDGVFIRDRKDVIGVCYAFVEFEEMFAVENAIKASPILFAGRQVYIEERRPNPSGVRGGRRGRGRVGYPTEAPRGRFGTRASGRGIHQDSGDYRPRGNSYYRGSR
ncbi:PREDICTED: putative G3BP-like protein [Tarenaya hassleriana]|uniref:putative G3BP-like protein n=1 Tax=Tarenaya hassleriana TaxID=28532 RepID=UPI00053C2242|nr:PREDICTED: putative G3BP-like protein [Tarenaya hassleriana]XP_010542906.1 PREDICTED: putative G3BP-like protein [Tarenaya hassleriana]